MKGDDIVPNRVISFDQSTQRTGWALFYNGNYVTHGIIDLHKITDVTKRFDEMIKEICMTISDAKADVVVIENTVMQSSPKVLRLLSQLQGAIIGYCVIRHIPYYIYYPTQWRKLLDFKQGVKTRSEQKKQSIDYIKEKFNFDTNDDEADALCIGLAYYKELGGLTE